MQKSRLNREIKHFTNLSHIWWGAKTVAGQKRYDNKAKLFKEICKINKNDRILEIGCGDGEFTKRIAKFGGSIVATDVTPVVVKKGQKVIKLKNVKFELGDAEKLKYGAGTFNVVCGISILHHVNFEKSLKEIYRVLKKGGRIFFTEPNLMNPHTFAGLHIKYLRNKMEFSDDETALIRWNMQKLLKQIGYKEVLVKNYDFLHPLTPVKMISFVEKAGFVLERIPLLKEVSGSLLITAVK